MKKMFFTAAVLFFLSCGNAPEQKTEFDTLGFHVATFGVEGGFGYDISVNGKKIISQNTVPAVEGNFVFKSADDALKVGKVVVEKMISAPGELPSVTPEEVKNLNIKLEQ